METPSPQTDSGLVTVDLWPHQYEAVFRCDQYRWLFEIGGRGSGKTYKDRVRIVRWAEMCTELPWGIFAATEEMLQSALVPIRETLDEMGVQYVHGQRTPQAWIDQWDRDGIEYPTQRFRSGKFLVLENGAHFFTGSIVNNAYTRAKGIDFNSILIVEGTEPGVSLNAVMTLFGGCRCGKAKRGKDGVWRCTEPGHLHQLVLEGNVPLNDPSHWIRKKHRQMQAMERKRELAGQPPFYRMLQSRTKDNPATGADYDAGLRAAFDEKTYTEQTSGDLDVNSAARSYWAFTEKNVMDVPHGNEPGLVYDPRRPLHLWCDWNAAPAAVGWGHDLRWDEVPEAERAKGHKYFGIIGELFSGADPLHTDQVADALLNEGASVGKCVELGCHHDLAKHVQMVTGYLCSVCAWRRPDVKTVQHCSGLAMQSPLDDNSRKYISAQSNWRGLMQHRAKIHVYADANDGRGNANAVKGGSIQIMRDMLGEALGEMVEFHIPESNPRVKERLLAVNRGFRDASGIASVFVGSWCEAHLSDFREVVPDANGEPLKVSKSPSQRRSGNDYWMRTDISDAWGYHWSYRHPFRVPKSDALPMGQGDDLGGPFHGEWPEP
jgi:hypothetical protein